MRVCKHVRAKCVCTVTCICNGAIDSGPAQKQPNPLHTLPSVQRKGVENRWEEKGVDLHTQRARRKGSGGQREPVPLQPAGSQLPAPRPRSLPLPLTKKTPPWPPQAGPTASHFQQIKAANLVNESSSASTSHAPPPRVGGSPGARACKACEAEPGAHRELLVSAPELVQEVIGQVHHTPWSRGPGPHLQEENCFGDRRAAGVELNGSEHDAAAAGEVAGGFSGVPAMVGASLPLW